MAIEPQDYEANDRHSTGEGRRNTEFDSTDSPASIRKEPQIATIRFGFIKSLISKDISIIWTF